jgi:hypothetical protein
MSYDEIFEAAGVDPAFGNRFPWSDVLQLLDYFIENWEPRKRASKGETNFTLQRMGHVPAEDHATADAREYRRPCIRVDTART